METVKLFEKYYKRLAREGLTKSVLCGLLVGFSAMLVAAFCFWMAGTKLFWLAVIPFVLGTAGSAPVFYYRKFKPTSSAVAARIDELGLEERMITMNELKNDDSYIARRQREDAVKSLGLVKAELIKLAVSIPLIVAVAVLGIAGLGMTTVSALAANEVVSSGKNMIDDIKKDPVVYYDVSYEIEGEGEILGNEVQRVENGKDATEVTAIAGEGFMFSKWSDGNENPTRQDLNITEDVTITAIFEEVEDGDDGDDDGDPDDADDSDDPGEPSEQPDSGKGDNGQGGGQGGEWKDNDTIIDGSTKYDDYYDDAKKDATEGAKDNSNMSQKDKDVNNGYFDNIKK